MDARKLDHRVGSRQGKRVVGVIKDERVSLERKFDHRVSRGVQGLTDTGRNA
jgi:hypothetical protein